VDLQSATAVVAIVVALGTYVATRLRDSAIHRAELVRQYTADFYASDAVVALFVDIDYDRFTFVEDEDTWLGHEPEALATTGTGMSSNWPTSMERPWVTPCFVPSNLKKSQSTWRL
jgi:hypothetical protein